MKTLSSVTDSSSRGTLAPDSQTIRLLHVDDETGFLTTTKQILELQNLFQVETASTVKEALKKLGETEFDAVVSDYQMPEKDGLTFLKELRESGSNISFILFTGKGREEVAIKALNLGADYYINKIGHPETVYSQLSHYVLQAVQKRKAENKLKHKVEFESAIVRISSRFVNPVDLNAALNESLADMGQISGASRVYIFLLYENGSMMDNTHEWCAEGVTPQIENLKKMPCENLPWWMKQLHDGKNIQVKDVSLMPPEAKAEKELLEKQDIKSVIVLSITVYGELAGFIGFDNVETAGDWGSDDVALLQVVSELIGNTLERKKSEEMYRAIFESTSTAMCIVDDDITISMVNRRFEELTGYSRAEVEGKNWMDFVAEEYWEPMQGFHEEKRKRGEKAPKNYTFNFINKNGKKISGLLTIELIPETKQSVASILDITDRIKTEEKLKDRERKYRLLTENITDVIFIQDLDLSIKYVSPSVEALSGYTPKEVLKLKPVQFIAPDSYEKALKTWKKAIVLADKVPDSDIRLMQYEYVRKDSSTFWGELRVKFLRDSKGKIVGTQGILRDVTERKETEEKLKEREKQFRLLTENFTDVIFIQNLDLSIKYVSPNIEALSGYTPEEIINLGPKFLMTEASFERGLADFKEAISLAAKNPDVELPLWRYEYIRKDGSKAWGEFKPKLLRDEEGNLVGMQGVLRDVTNRITTEEKLKESERKYRLLTENITDVIFIQDMNLRVTYVSPSVENLSGYTPEEILNLSTEDFMTPNSFARGVTDFKNAIGLAMEGRDSEIPLTQYEYICKDGSTFWGELKTKMLRDSNGQLVGLQGTLRDITERKRAEESLDKIVKELMIINEKLGVVGKLTRHDARNKLSIITNNVYLAKQQLADNHSSLEYLAGIESAIEQMDKIFSFARTYEMLGVENLSYMGVKSCVDEASSLFSGMNGVNLVNDCSGLTVLADSFLRQLFYNLIDDSLKHGEKVTQIKVYYEEGDNQLNLIYEDDGVGIPEDEKGKIFREGYGKGTGYGLYLIRKMCDVYGWAVKETGTPKKGAQFTITIPKTTQNKKIAYNVS